MLLPLKDTLCNTRLLCPLAPYVLLWLHVAYTCSATPLPVPDVRECLGRADALLRNITGVLEPDKLGFYCSDSVEIRKTTLSACEPNPKQDERCTRPLSSNFNQESCFSAIMVDLQRYLDLLVTYEVNAIIGVSSSLQDMMKDCSFAAAGSTSPSHMALMAAPTTVPPFYQQVELCKILRGFRIRSISINRVISYIAAGDHLK